MAAPEGDPPHIPPPPPPPPLEKEIDPDGQGIDYQANRANRKSYLGFLHMGPKNILRSIFRRSSEPLEDISADNLNPLVLLTEGQRLESENDQLQTEISTLKETITMMDGTISNLNIQIEHLKKKKHGEDFMFTQRQISELHKNHERVLERLQSAHNIKTLKLRTDYKSLFEKYEAQLEQLRDATHELQRVAPLYHEAKGENVSLKKSNEQLEALVFKLQSDLSRSKEHMVGLKKMIKNLEKMLNDHINKVIFMFLFFLFFSVFW